MSSSTSIAILLLGNAQASSSRTALNFVRSAVQQGIVIDCLFFYHDAVQLASTLSIAPQDEQNLANDWQQLIQQHQLPAIACIASALKHGIINGAEAKRYSKNSHNLHPAFELAGLGSWLEAVKRADQHLAFG